MKKNLTALITGASSGIGYELARVFASHGYSLVLVARNREKLTQLKSELESKHSIQVTVLPKDLAQPQAPDEVYRDLHKQNIPIDVLVNNAGFGDYGMFSESDWNKISEMLQVNIVALTQLTRLFLPAMIQNKNGKILNVASTAAFQPGPLMAVYYATKAYVLHFSEGIANELEPSGISVTTLCPGPTQSQFQSTASLDGSRLFEARKLPTSLEVAEFGYQALERKKRVAIHGAFNKMLTWGIRLLPRKTITSMVRQVQEIK